MAEMEWEFNEDGSSSDGQFMATGKVINFLRGHLARGEIDKAVDLYESCVQNVGDQVWAEFEGASVPMKKSIANLFFRARDYARSAAACEKLGEWMAAGKSYEAAYDLPRAAACYLKAGNKDKAAAVMEKSGQHRKAAELYYDSNQLDASAIALERGGDPIGAAQLYLKKPDLKKAAQLLAQVQPGDTRFQQAVALLAEALIQMNRKDLAIQRLAAAVPKGQPIRDNLTAELGYRLGRLLLEVNQADQARPILELVRAFNPAFKDVTELLGAGGASAPVAPAVTTPMRKPGSSRDTIPTPPPANMGTDPFSALDGNPFAPRRDASSPVGPSPGGSSPVGSAPAASRPSESIPGYVTRMEGYEVLKKMPIFAELSLEEMKAFHAICEQVFYTKGQVIIEQGTQGQALVIVREGSLKVSKIEGGREIALATLPAGTFVGEMSLIDDAPTSARVTAAEGVKALRVTRDRFQQFMFANDRIALRVYHAFLRTLSGRLRELNAQKKS